ncbi:MAG TPA: hypothetical protein VGI95_20850 [Caulobacteraceae bacterium]|jgi:hypothetical protein
MSHLRLAAATAVVLALASAAAAQQPTSGVRQLCAADIQKLCPNAKMGPGGGMRECVKDHFSALSKPCQSAINDMRAKMQQSGGQP